MLAIIATLNFCFTTRPYTSNAVRQIKAQGRTVVRAAVKSISHLLLVGTFVRLVGSSLVAWRVRELVVRHFANHQIRKSTSLAFEYVDHVHGSSCVREIRADFIDFLCK